MPGRTITGPQKGSSSMLPRCSAVIGALFMLAACSSNPPPEPGGPGGIGPGGPGGINSSRVGPGSQQDLAQTAGDRVFFDYARPAITPEGQEILRRHARSEEH